MGDEVGESVGVDVGKSVGDSVGSIWPPITKFWGNADDANVDSIVGYNDC